MRKKAVSILLTLAMAFSLAACGQDAGETTEAPKETEKATETATEAPAETEATTETAGETGAEESKAEEKGTDGQTETDKINPTGTKYKIALSNSFMGNDWRQQMERVVEYVATQEPYASRCELTIVNCENDAESQSASIDALVQQGYDAILVDPASETGVNQAIQRACDAGITVVVFDQPASVSTDGCWHIRFDGARNYSILAKWMAEAIGGEGNVVLDQGLQGAAEAELEYNASKEMFESYPGINIVSDYQSNYGLSEGEQALASVIAANPDVDAVTTQGYVVPSSMPLRRRDLTFP